MKGVAVDEAEIAREIAPCFIERHGRRTDFVVLACTHYPLLREHFARLAPWPVNYVDPAPAIARRVDALLGPAGAPARTGVRAAIFTSGAEPGAALQGALLKFGLVAAPTDAAVFQFARP